MGTDVHSVWQNGVHLGYVRYATASDIWGEALYRSVADCLGEHDRIGRYTCERTPDMEDPHPVEWVSVVHWYYPQSAFLYCPNCRCLVTPPYDGYVYLDYPKAWTRRAGEEPTWEGP